MLTDAASVILLRQGIGDLEVYLCRRHRQAHFAAGAFVFPGGRLDADDEAEELWRRTVFPPPQARHEGFPRGLYLAAIRELFEEAGVLLAEADGERTLVSMAQRLQQARGALHESRAVFGQLIHELELTCRADRLVPFAHWITPEIEPRRYDTRFFLARWPERQEPIDDEREVFEGRWLTPQEALDENRAGRLFLYPPTYWILEDLTSWSRLDPLFAVAPERTIEPVMPRIRPQADGRVLFVLPGDPEYAEALENPPDPAERCRVVLEDGCLRTLRPEPTD